MEELSFKLDVFEGPLDLLLHLIQKNKVSVYDIPIETQKNPSSVGVYDNNQSIVRDEEAEIKGRTYLKHFYEKNEHMQDIDTLV